MISIFQDCIKSSGDLMRVVMRNEPFHCYNTFRQRMDDGLLELLASQLRDEALHRIGL